MNKKNTIIIAVLINAGLLAVLFVTALTTQDELPAANPIMAEAPLTLPKFEEPPMLNELPPIAVIESAKPLEILENTQVLHQLPPMEIAAAPIPAPVAAVQPTIPAAMPMPNHKQVSVKKGDSLEKIARHNHTTVDDIIKMNGLQNTFLKIGQVLKIPAEKTLAKSVEKKVADLGPEYYTMKVGDNPWAIAMKHHMKVDELLRLNGLNEERARKLKPGDRLRTR